MEKNQNNNVVKAGIGYTIGNYLIKGLAFITVPIFSRLLSTSDYGIYNIFIATEGILYVLIGMAMHSNYKSARYHFGLIKEGSEPGKDFDTYVASTMVLIILGSCVWSVILFLNADFIYDWLSLDIEVVFFLVLYSTASAIIACYNAYVGLEYKYKSFIRIASLNAISNVFLSIVLMITFFCEKRYLGRIIGTTIPAVLIAIYIVNLFFKKSIPKNLFYFWKWGVNYSLPIIPNGIGQTILSQFDRIMINGMIGASAAGIYSFGYNIFGLVNVTALSLDNVWSPWLFEKMKKKEYKVISKQASKYVVMMTLFSCGVILVSPELVKILGDVAYWDATYSVIPLVASGFFLFLSSLPISVEYYYENTKLIAMGTGLAALINVLLNYYAISRFGYIAAAYTTLITYFLYFVFHMYVASKINKSNLFSLKVICGCTLFLVIILVISLLFINKLLIRLIVVFIDTLLFIYAEEKCLGIIGTLLKRR